MLKTIGLPGFVHRTIQPNIAYRRYIGMDTLSVHQCISKIFYNDKEFSNVVITVCSIHSLTKNVLRTNDRYKL